ncbi:MAG: glycosyltransferase family 4 protein [Anaerolineales bacterium]|nr:glycosyltransferase family 4 protein [Anaerolineales bacterium]
MRLTILNQFYKPDLAPTGHMAASLAKHRAEQGDDVTVITSRGGYVSESATASEPQSTNPRVYRLWTPRLGKSTALARLADYVSFYILAFLRSVTLPKQDIIISLTTPPFIAWAAIFHKFLHRSTKVVLWNMDCYPEIAERAGVMEKGGFFSRLLRKLNHGLFRRLDQLICLDKAMLDLLVSQYVPTGHALATCIIPNWEKASQFPPDLSPDPWDAAATSIKDDDFVILYLGNAGFGHRFETIIEAAKRLKDEPVVFLFIGGGEKWAWIEQAIVANDLRNIHLFRYIPKELTPSALAMADCTLITMNDSALGVISPSKLHAYLAMSLPTLYIGPEGSNVDEAIERFDAGASLRHGDVEGSILFINELRTQPERLQALRRNARRAFDDAFCDTQTLPMFDQMLSQLFSE